MDKHFASTKHMTRMQASAQPPRQITFTEAAASRAIATTERIKICEDWVSTCTAVNIPLSVSDHPAMRQFLNNKVINGGAIPGYHQLQEKYLDAVYQKEKEALMIHVAKKPVAVIFDETPDVEGRYVLNILIAPIEKDKSGRILAYLADTVFLKQCNHSTVSQAVVQCLHEYSIANEDVIVFDTDNAAYMKKAYTAALQSLFPNSVHITCMAHIMNLIGNAFRRPFEKVNAFMLSFSQMFYQAGARKRRYLQFMSEKLPPGRKATVAPNPCATRWNSWFTAVQYHSEHFPWYKDFIKMEVETCGKSVPHSVERLHEMLHHNDEALRLQVQINIMADKCKIILRLIDIFQSRFPATTKLFNYLEDLQMNFAANKELRYEACTQYFDGLDLSFAAKDILKTVEQGYDNAEEKLAKYMSDGQPAINFLKQVMVFDPCHIAFLSESVASYTYIPGFAAVPQGEMDAYVTRLGPEALKVSSCGVVNLDVFWDGLQERLPMLSSLAKRYKDAVINSADAERSNSIYKLVLSSRRRSISNSHLKALVFLYHNQRLTSGAFEQHEVAEVDSEEEDMEE